MYDQIRYWWSLDLTGVARCISSSTFSGSSVKIKSRTEDFCPGLCHVGWEICWVKNDSWVMSINFEVRLLSPPITELLLQSIFGKLKFPSGYEDKCVVSKFCNKWRSLSLLIAEGFGYPYIEPINILSEPLKVIEHQTESSTR